MVTTKGDIMSYYSAYINYYMGVFEGIFINLFLEEFSVHPTKSQKEHIQNSFNERFPNYDFSPRFISSNAHWIN